MKSIPKGWALAFIRDLAERCGGGTPTRSRPEFFRGALPWFTVADLPAIGSAPPMVSQSREGITREAIKSSAAKVIPKGSVLFATRVSVGKTAIASRDIATNQDFRSVLPGDAHLPEYLAWYLSHTAVFNLPQDRGTTIKGITSDAFDSIKVPIPPLPEQRRIVAKIEALMARSRTTREALEQIPELLKQYRQSVLAVAISGELTKGWRTQHGANASLGETTLESVAQVGTGSTPLRSNTGYFASSGTPWITSAATGLPFVSSASEFVTESAIHNHRLKKYPKGTLLIAMYGEGKTRGQTTELMIEATINQACAAIVVDESKVRRGFIKLVLQANYLSMRALAEGGNQPNLNLRKVKQFSFKLPSLEEQDEVLQRTERLLSRVDFVAGIFGESLTHLESLSASILVKAFRGELVPQDPADEPAEALLARVRAEREAGAVAPKTRSRGVSKVQPMPAPPKRRRAKAQ